MTLVVLTVLLVLAMAAGLVAIDRLAARAGEDLGRVMDESLDELKRRERLSRVARRVIEARVFEKTANERIDGGERWLGAMLAVQSEHAWREAAVELLKALA